VIKYIIFIVWLLFVVLWNYYLPNATPFEDVFMAVCFSLFAKSLERNLLSDPK
jgi:hypothetical protein